MEYNTWVKLCEMSLSLGFEIVRMDKNKGKVFTSTNTDILTDDIGNWYLFHLPEAGELKIITDTMRREILEHGYTPVNNTIIETGFSRFNESDRSIQSNRLFIQAGYYNSEGIFIYHPECIDKEI